MKVELVYGVASCVHSFRPKPLRRLELSKHRPRHVDKSPVLPLYHTILLWCVGSRALMLDAFLLKVLLHLQILELGPVVASYLFHLERFESSLESALGSLGFLIYPRKRIPK
jgi:hypothetical protein